MKSNFRDILEEKLRDKETFKPHNEFDFLAKQDGLPSYFSYLLGRQNKQSNNSSPHMFNAYKKFINPKIKEAPSLEIVDEPIIEKIISLSDLNKFQLNAYKKINNMGWTLSPNFTETQLKKFYKNLVFNIHPDLNADNEQEKEFLNIKLVLVIESYNSLKTVFL